MSTESINRVHLQIHKSNKGKTWPECFYSLVLCMKIKQLIMALRACVFEEN